MYSLVTGIYQSYFAPPKLSILMIGIDGSGKTALLERIKVTGISSSAVDDDDDDDDDDDLAPYWSSPRGTGAAVAVGGCDDDDDDDENSCYRDDGGPAKRRDGSRRRPPSRRGGGGKPARLPPPLPPRLASRGRLRVKEMMVGGFDDDDDGGGWDAPAPPGREDDDDVRRALLHGVSPPPLFGGDDEGRMILTPRSDRIKSILLPDIVELSPGFNSVTIMSTPRPPATTPASSSSAAGRHPAVSPAKLNGLVGLLSRCPSPSRYANAALLGREEEELEEEVYDDGEGIDGGGINDAVPPDDDGTWNADYLNGYAIDYREDEEFDHDGGGGGGRHHRRHGGRGRQSSAGRMMPLDRIRPTLGQNLAKLDLCGCKCSLFDLSGAVSSSSSRCYRFVSLLGSVALSGPPCLLMIGFFSFFGWAPPRPIRPSVFVS
jgi:hypothetical protein